MEVFLAEKVESGYSEHSEIRNKHVLHLFSSTLKECKVNVILDGYLTVFIFFRPHDIITNIYANKVTAYIHQFVSPVFPQNKR